MKVLIVCSGNSGLIKPFISEQALGLEKSGVIIDYFVVKGKGITGYLKNLPNLRRSIKIFQPDLIHAHYGLSGLLSILQFRIPVIVTYHNGEILSLKVNLLSSLVSFFSKYDIYVANHIYSKLIFKKSRNFDIIPCGIDLKVMQILNSSLKKHQFIDIKKINILFGGTFENKRKNYSLACQAISRITSVSVNLIELKGLSREEVCQLLNECYLALLPSESEGSPQFIKEAMACNCPIVATNVGDIKEIIGNTEGCYLTSFDPDDVADKIKKAIEFGKRTDGRKKIMHFDNDLIVEKLLSVYKSVINKNKLN